MLLYRFVNYIVFFLLNKLFSKQLSEPPAAKKRPKDEITSLKTFVGRPATESNKLTILTQSSATNVASQPQPGSVAKDEKEAKPLVSPNTNLTNNAQQPTQIFDNIMPELKALVSKETKSKFPAALVPDVEMKDIGNPPITNFDNSFPLQNVTSQQQQIQTQKSTNNNIINPPTTTTATNSNGNTMNVPFMDPLEHSLASLESSQEKQQDMDALLRDFQKHHQQQQQHQLQMPIVPPHMSQQQQNAQQSVQQHSHNAAAALNHLVSEFNGVNGNPMNGIMNILGMPSAADVANQFVNQQMRGWQNSMPVPPLQSLTLLNTEAAVAMSQNAVNFSQKNEKMLLTPKPIEELLAAPLSNDKTKILQAETRVSHAFGQTFKYEQNNLKNPTNVKHDAWSQLAQAEASQIGANKGRMPSDTFQEFKNKAKEQRQKQMENEKIKIQKEQEFKRQQENLFKQGKNEETIAQRYNNLKIF